ncbi:DUF1499 domain-containing protein [Notoacmeibacter marinus]|uniref:DUF1499 domain-containing protein n=1 Tax=Notoacmeibacter marinus TaxID=1876515 RepID=UPI001303ECD8|nr:DUF1499 domain-containing protein [Notoacmeibacter marinus]
MKIAFLIAAAIAVLAIVAFLGLVLYGRTTGWETATRSADQGAYDFAASPRSATDNDALACSEGLCEKPDIILPKPSEDAQAAFAELAHRIATETDDVERVDDGADPAYRRYVVRTPLIRFPDTVDIRWSPEGWRAMSRSLIGRSDLGANEARLRRWFGQSQWPS